MLRIDAKSSRELQALILGIRRADREVQAQIRKHTKPMVQTEWQKGLAEHADTPLEHRVLVMTGRATVSNQNVKLKAGGLAKKMSGGAVTYELASQTEFGATPKKATYSGRRGSKRYPIERTVNTGFKRPNRRGYVVYPTAADLIPRIASLWVQTAVRTLHEVFERKA